MQAIAPPSTSGSGQAPLVPSEHWLALASGNADLARLLEAVAKGDVRPPQLTPTVSQEPMPVAPAPVAATPPVEEYPAPQELAESLDITSTSSIPDSPQLTPDSSIREEAPVSRPRPVVLPFYHDPVLQEKKTVSTRAEILARKVSNTQDALVPQSFLCPLSSCGRSLMTPLLLRMHTEMVHRQVPVSHQPTCHMPITVPYDDGPHQRLSVFAGCCLRTGRRDQASRASNILCHSRSEPLTSCSGPTNLYRIMAQNDTNTCSGPLLGA